MNCRICGAFLKKQVLDLGCAPPSIAYLATADLTKPERTYPLGLMICENCFLVQTEDYSQREELFSCDYAYFSSDSSYWLAHAKSYCEMISKHKKADLIIHNNVFAHVPDINDFTAGLNEVLQVGSTINIEFPHLLNLVRLNQCDTVYHEHYSYLALHTVEKMFNCWGLKVYDVEKRDTKHDNTFLIIESKPKISFL